MIREIAEITADFSEMQHCATGSKIASYNFAKKQTAGLVRLGKDGYTLLSKHTPGDIEEIVALTREALNLVEYHTFNVFMINGDAPTIGAIGCCGNLARMSVWDEEDWIEREKYLWQLCGSSDGSLLQAEDVGYVAVPLAFGIPEDKLPAVTEFLTAKAQFLSDHILKL